MLFETKRQMKHIGTKVAYYDSKLQLFLRISSLSVRFTLIISKKIGIIHFCLAIFQIITKFADEKCVLRHTIVHPIAIWPPLWRWHQRKELSKKSVY